MNETILHQKNELLQWILALEDESLIKKIDEFRKEISSENVVRESKTEYRVKDDFDERFAKGIPHEEMKRRTIEYIENLPWKK